MNTITPYIGITYVLFLLGYWCATGIILYHLHKYGLGRHTKRILYIILSGSILLTVITTIVYLKL